jgi:hypothetical protein
MLASATLVELPVQIFGLLLWKAWILFYCYAQEI